MIFGLKTSEPFPEGWTPIEAVAVLKCLDDEGQLAFVLRSTQTLTDWECFALLQLAAESQKREIVEGFESE